MNIIKYAAAALLGLGLSVATFAQTYPTKPVKVMVAKLHEEVQKALQNKEVQGRLSAAGGEVLPASSEAFGALIKSERARYAKLVKEANIKPE